MWVVLTAGVMCLFASPQAVALAPSREPTRQTTAADRVEARVSELQRRGLLITADPKRIAAVTSEAAYFMFADRQDHRPRRMRLEWPKGKSWLAGKRVFGNGSRLEKEERERIDALFRELLAAAGYDTVWIYDADVRYGVNSHARFTLYKLGFSPEARPDGPMPEILLGDGAYVLCLP